MPEAPSRQQVESKFLALLDGAASRDDVDRWAAQWVAADDDGVDDPHVWWALTRLCGIDLRHGPGQDYLHLDDQVQEWLREFKLRCSGEGG